MLTKINKEKDKIITWNTIKNKFFWSAWAASTRSSMRSTISSVSCSPSLFWSLFEAVRRRFSPLSNKRALERKINKQTWAATKTKEFLFNLEWGHHPTIQNQMELPSF